MKLTFFGAAREVGRSAILVESEDEKILLDCGIKMKKNEEFPLIENSEIKKLTKVVLSHAHLDHSGYLPALYAAGYEGKVYMTKPTRDLIQLLLADALKIQKEWSPYNKSDVDALLKNIEILEYNQLSKDKIIRFQNAGHILGSAMTEIFLEGKKLLYTGDINLRSSRLLSGCKTGMEADFLIIESTYGGKEDLHVPTKEATTEFISKIREVQQEGGKILIPTFAVGRGQEILFTLENHLKSGLMEETTIFLDGMVKKALKIYRHNAIYLKKEVQRRILSGDDDPFKSDFYKFPKTKSKREVFQSKKAIILSTSGMMTGGPVMGYLEKMADDEKNILIIVGYQSEGSPGRKLLEGEKKLRYKEKIIDVKMRVWSSPFSAHSDHKELVQFVRSMKSLKKVFVVHGERERLFDLAEAVKSKNTESFIPHLKESFEL